MPHIRCSNGLLHCVTKLLLLWRAENLLLLFLCNCMSHSSVHFCTYWPWVSGWVHMCEGLCKRTSSKDIVGWLRLFPRLWLELLRIILEGAVLLFFYKRVASLWFNSIHHLFDWAEVLVAILRLMLVFHSQTSSCHWTISSRLCLSLIQIKSSMHIWVPSIIFLVLFNTTSSLAFACSQLCMPTNLYTRVFWLSCKVI